ncbi:MAG: CpaF family protein, partial [Asticcacaulis sp.]
MFGKRPTEQGGKGPSPARPVEAAREVRPQALSQNPLGQGAPAASPGPAAGAVQTPLQQSQALLAKIGAAPPPASAASDIATRPQSAENRPNSGSAKTPLPELSAEKRVGAPDPATKPKLAAGLEQMHKAQTVTEIVREQSDYYHATKTAIFNALLITIDLSQLAQLNHKAAAEEIRDIVAELV